ncbi:hypothetical protein QE422_001778 [Chryseobacterium sp. SORGH_AS 447]|uniref:hypothetical protein n=1 Tax=Chryseobacterium sp. SORGH_AS_0447 TaxID=3041769 RepID=UPI00278B37B8|nr:hypothetical protein [Chryseobacterium sp. SORGH_AS_0447]MDQ1161410.1 hypothetical protein [Chryseobacterium sp. SORGH_AS_0447]
MLTEIAEDLDAKKEDSSCNKRKNKILLFKRGCPNFSDNLILFSRGIVTFDSFVAELKLAKLVSDIGLNPEELVLFK